MKWSYEVSVRDTASKRNADFSPLPGPMRANAGKSRQPRNIPRCARIYSVLRKIGAACGKMDGKAMNALTPAQKIFVFRRDCVRSPGRRRNVGRTLGSADTLVISHSPCLE
ncbi:MAG: hypothetical protein DME19_09065 [Verrucomicrobia bacterium]|nr:MAG: hypothetical protein DME19_09065 [Verrucomicrobiota bacterium]